MALAGELALSNPTLDALPPPLLRAIFTSLPADQRARASCVCRTWRDLISDPALWLRLDLRALAGITCRVDDAALHAACARAQGRLEALDVTGRQDWLPPSAYFSLAEIRAHASLKRLSLECSTIVEGRERCVEQTIDVALALGLTSLELIYCELTPAAVPALVRLLSSTALTRLVICNDYEDPAVLLDATAAALLANALRANCTLLEFTLTSVGLWQNMDSAAVLLGALAGHASLRVLGISSESVETENEADGEVAGALLGRHCAAPASRTSCQHLAAQVMGA